MWMLTLSYSPTDSWDSVHFIFLVYFLSVQIGLFLFFIFQSLILSILLLTFLCFVSLLYFLAKSTEFVLLLYFSVQNFPLILLYIFLFLWCTFFIYFLRLYTFSFVSSVYVITHWSICIMVFKNLGQRILVSLSSWLSLLCFGGGN